MLRTTIGQVVVNAGLPEELRDYGRVLDKSGLKKLLQQVIEKYPDRYREIVQHLGAVGYKTSDLTGGNSFDLPHMRLSVAGRKFQTEARAFVDRLYADPKLDDDAKDARLIEYLQSRGDQLTSDVMRESLAEDNPLAHQIVSGARGSAVNLRSLRAGDLLYVDHRNRVLPVPILRSYSQGLTPAEYYAGLFGARQGVISAKFAVRDSGYLNKQLVQAAHRLVVSGLDADDADDAGKEAGDPRGLPVSVDDPDNEGALLAAPVAGYARNTVLTPKLLAELRAAGHTRLLVRSPLVGGHPNGGVYARDVGVRERGGLPSVGDQVGIAAAGAASEPLTQGLLGAKHGGGVAGSKKNTGPSGFHLVDQLVQVPKTFKGGAAHAQADGRVTAVRPAPQGGTYVTVGSTQHYVGRGYDPLVKVGDEVEAGDVLSEGVPNPAEVVKHKGLGEGRRYFTDQFVRAYRDAGLPIHRRNAELIARGLINHVTLSDEVGHHLPGDVVPYHQLEGSWEPRPGHRLVDLTKARGKYLERPVLHYSIGTRVTPAAVRQLQEFGVKQLTVHDEPPPFAPTMIRGVETLTHDPDWMTRFLGAYVKKNFLKGVHRGDAADEAGSSYVASLARTVDFGRQAPMVSSPPGQPPRPPVPAPSIMDQINHPPPAKEASLVDRLRAKAAAAAAGRDRPTVDDVLAGSKLLYEAGETVELADPPADEDDEPDYPTEITYPVAVRALAGHTAEDGEPVEAMVGSDPRGRSGTFVVRRPEAFRTETKAYARLSEEEFDLVMRAFAPLLTGPPRDAGRGGLAASLARFRRSS